MRIRPITAFPLSGIVGALVAVIVLVLVPAVVSAATATTTISSVVSPVISLFTTSVTVNINATPTIAGVQTIAKDTVTISTNDSAGYTLQVAETGVTTLTSGGNTIPASAGTQAVPVVMATNTWGYRVDGIGGFGAGPTSAVSNTAISGTVKFAGVPVAASPNTIKTTAGTATNDATSVWFGVAVTTAQPSGTYTNGITYTATAN